LTWVEVQGVDAAGQVDPAAVDEVEVLEVDEVDQAAADPAEALRGEPRAPQAAERGVAAAAVDGGVDLRQRVGPGEDQVERAVGVDGRPGQVAGAVHLDGDLRPLGGRIIEPAELTRHHPGHRR